MTVNILGLNYLPESTSIGPYTAGLAEYLNSRGHRVNVVTGFPMAPQWKVWEQYRGKVYMREVVNGVRVLRTYVYVPKNPRKALRRILFDCSFALSALVSCISLPKPDLIVIVSPPLQLALTALLVTLIWRAPVFIHIKDLVPDAAIAVGALAQGSLAVLVARALERFVYRKVDSIGVICDGMRRNLLAKGVPSRKVVMLPDYIDLGPSKAIQKNGSFRNRFNIPSNTFLAMYSGSVAGKQGLDTFVEASAVLSPADSITCCLIGEGPYLSELNEFAKRVSARCLLCLPLQPREFLWEQLCAADVLVITQKKAISDMVFPGKLLFYMASGRPILAAVSEDSETGTFILQNGVGLVVPPEEPILLAEALVWMRTHRDRIEEFGQNGRRVVETRFDQNTVLEAFAKHLEGLNRSGS